ncbi:MAG: SpoIIE family protein phosphatase [Victivallaceae bacterium]
MFKNRSLAFKQSFYILLSVIIVYVGIFSYITGYVWTLMLSGIKDSTRNIGESTANRLDQIFIEAARLGKQLALQVENSKMTDEQIGKMLTVTLEGIQYERPEIYSLSVAYAPYAFDKNKEYYMVYSSRKEGGIKLEHDGGPDYEYFYYNWYTLPKTLESPVWTEPYFDEVMMSTYAVPFYRERNGRREFAGVITVDLSLSWLEKAVSSIKLNNSGYAFLISKFGRIITHPDAERIMNETIFSIAEEREDQIMRDAGREMIAGKSGFVPYKKHLISQKKSWMFYAPLQSNGWSLGIIFPEDQLFAAIAKMEITIFSLFAVGMLLLLSVIIWITLKITRPLRILTQATGEIGSGNFHAAMPEITSNDEIGKLSSAFSAMQAALVKHIENLKETTAAKEKIESELKIAKDIQMGILPQLLPPFPECKEFSLFAVLNSAKAVGGDLYDFFYLDPDHLCIVVGDVSGKGVPASLFMAVTQTLHRGVANAGMDTGEIVTKVSKSLSQNNETSMFVTYFMIILNIRTGEMQYTNAGHNPPFILRDGAGITKISNRHGPPVGVAELDYGMDMTSLNHGDTLVLYTDGVTEAMDINNHEFGESRLLEILNDCKANPDPKNITKTVLYAVSKFTAGQEQSDDITILALRFI